MCEMIAASACSVKRVRCLQAKIILCVKKGEGLTDNNYRSSTVNSNMVYSKFHLIQIFGHIIFSTLLSSYVSNALLIRIPLNSKENIVDK